MGSSGGYTCSGLYLCLLYASECVCVEGSLRNRVLIIISALLQMLPAAMATSVLATSYTSVIPPMHGRHNAHEWIAVSICLPTYVHTCHHTK